MKQMKKEECRKQKQEGITRSVLKYFSLPPSAFSLFSK